MNHPIYNAIVTMSPNVRPLVIQRNVKRLERNIKEYKAKLEDIENAWPWGAPSKIVQDDYDYVYQCYIDDSELLAALKELAV